MTWKFKVRDEVVTLNSVDSITAVYPTREFRSKARLDDYSARFGKVIGCDDPGDSPNRLSHKDRERFERGGWWFVAANQDVADAARTREPLPNAKVARQVYVSESGALLIGTSLATVKLPPDMTEDQAEYALQEDGLTKVYKLGFGRNLYEV